MSFKVTFSTPPAFTATFSGGEGFKADFENTIEIPVGEFYTGDYVVVPKANEAQILPTKMLIMSEDLTVTKVPYYQTSNPYGDTAYIASEVI